MIQPTVEMQMNRQGAKTPRKIKEKSSPEFLGVLALWRFNLSRLVNHVA
jgi:hypothetical protein